MSGDSAGGNLVAAMHVYMLQNNLSEFMADHLLFVSVPTYAPNASSPLTNQTECLSRFSHFLSRYSVFMVSCTAMTPSRILSLFDPMLPYETVCMCLSAYLGPKEDESATNPLISPIAASDEVLSKFPPSTLVAAQVSL
jgi:acetyl esterase/lipase